VDSISRCLPGFVPSPVSEPPSCPTVNINTLYLSDRYPYTLCDSGFPGKKSLNPLSFSSIGVQTLATKREIVRSSRGLQLSRSASS
jgi:hypothetical protein